MRTRTIAIAQKQSLETNRFIMLLLMSVSIYLLLIHPALAAGTPMGAVLCAVAGMVAGDVGRGLATIAIMIIGIGATLGKVSWGLVITVAVGISVIFGATDIAAALGFTGC